MESKYAIGFVILIISTFFINKFMDKKKYLLLFVIYLMIFILYLLGR